MPEKWKNPVHKQKVFEALLSDLKKAFDCTGHELLVAKLHAYGLALFAL